VLQEKIEKIDKYLKKIYEDYADEVLEKTDYINLKTQYNSDKSKIIIQIDEIDTTLSQTGLFQKKQDEWITKFKNYIDIDKLTRDMVVEMIDKIEIGKDNEVHIFFKFSNEQKLIQ